MAELHSYTCSFRVRSYECDSLGHVNNAVYQQYLQEAAIDASAAAGYPMEWYGRRGEGWFVRQMSLEYLRPAVAGDSLDVTTWISGWSRVRAQREYRVERAGEPIVRASASWVFVDVATRRPKAIPTEFAADFGVGGETMVQPARLPERGLDSGAWRWRHRVARYELDSNRHVNNAVYLNWVEEAKFLAAYQCGWSVERMGDEDLAIVQIRHDTEYFLPARYGDGVEVTSRLFEMRKVRGTWLHEIRRVGTDELLARNYSAGAFLDRRGRPRRLPESMLAALLRGESRHAEPKP